MAQLRPDFTTRNLADPTRGARGALDSAAKLLAQYEAEQQFDQTRGDTILNQALQAQDRKARLALQEKELAARNAARAAAEKRLKAEDTAAVRMLATLPEDTITTPGLDEGLLAEAAAQTVSQVDRPDLGPSTLPVFGAVGRGQLSDLDIQKQAQQKALDVAAERDPRLKQPRSRIQKIRDTAGDVGTAIAPYTTGGGLLSTILDKGVKAGQGVYDYFTAAPVSEYDRMQAEIQQAGGPKKTEDLSLGALAQKYTQELTGQRDLAAKLERDTKTQSTAQIAKNKKLLSDLPKEEQESLGLITEQERLRTVEEKMAPLLQDLQSMPDGPEKNAYAKSILKHREGLMATEGKKTDRLLKERNELIKDQRKFQADIQKLILKDELDKAGAQFDIKDITKFEKAYELSKDDGGFFGSTETFPDWMLKNYGATVTQNVLGTIPK